MSLSVSLNGNIQVTDSTSNAVASQKRLASLSVTGKNLSEAQSQLIGTSPVTIALPASPANFLYIKNLDTVNTVTVTWTRNGGSSASVIVFNPGGWAIVGCPGTGTGLTALSVVASSSNTPIEYILLS
jgi:hypothetical protein